LVASCKISESSATQEPRIKIQTNIVPSLRRLYPDAMFPYPRQRTQANFERKAAPTPPKIYCL
jgi:hypothetical protein